jgi:hypothetical protein
VRSEFREQVHISCYEKILGDHHHGVPELRKHFQTAPRDSSRALDRLVWVRDAGERQRLRSPTRGAKLVAEELRRVLLDEDLGLEVETGRQTQVLVGRAGITIRAAVLAASVRVYARVESYVGTAVSGDDRS